MRMWMIKSDQISQKIVDYFSRASMYNKQKSNKKDFNVKFVMS